MENKNKVSPTYQKAVKGLFIGGFILIGITLLFSLKAPDTEQTDRIQQIKALNLQRIELETLS